MPTFFEVLKGMQEHLSGTITGRVGIVPAPSVPLSDEPPPYATVAPGVQGDGIHTQSDFRHPKAGKLLVTAWAKPNTASDEEDTRRLLNTSRLLTERATSATVGMHFSVVTIDAPVAVDDREGILLYQTAEVSFFWRED